MYIHNNVGEIKENVVGGYDSYLTRDQQFLRNILLSDTCYLCSLLQKSHHDSKLSMDHAVYTDNAQDYCFLKFNSTCQGQLFRYSRQ